VSLIAFLFIIRTQVWASFMRIVFGTIGGLTMLNDRHRQAKYFDNKKAKMKSKMKTSIQRVCSIQRLASGQGNALAHQD
jgi:predicted small integral membrane protein